MTHITLTSVVVFLVIAAFGAMVFALARFASHGAFSPAVRDDEAPEDKGSTGNELDANDEQAV